MANDFTDSRCKALWRFENGALTTDSKGTNTLTAVGTPAVDLTNFKEGSGAINLVRASSQYLYRTDTDLDAGFPLKNGDAVKKGTWAFWMRPEILTAGNYYDVMAKGGWNPANRSLYLGFVGTTLYINWGKGTGTTYEDFTIAGFQVNRYYHIGIVFDGVNKVLLVRVWDDTAGIATTYTFSPTAEMYVGAGDFSVARFPSNTTSCLDGQIDEVVVFNDLLTATEIDKIRAGTYGVYEYTSAGIPLTLTPESACAGPIEYRGNLLLRLTPIATCELFDPGAVDAIPASTGGWAMGGAGVIVSTTPSATVIPAIDVATGLPFVSETGLVFGGGTTEVGIAEVTTTYPQADVIVAEEIGFVFCGPEVTGNAATTFPASEVIVAPAAFEFGGAGVITQVAAADIPSVVLIGTGGFVLSGSGFPLDPAVTPTATVITPTGGWRLGGLRPDPVEVTYPDDLDRVIIGSGGFEFCGDEGVWEESTPGATVILTDGAIFAMSGAGLATSRMPPIAVITGDALGGWVLGGTGWPLAEEVFEAWCLSGQAFEPSVFSGFNFNSFCEKGGVAYAAGDAGIYLLGGDHDAGEPIRSGVRIGPLNAGSDGTKRVRSVQFGQGGKDTSVRVTTDGGESGVFVSERDDSRAVISRNIQGQEFTVDVMEFAELSQFEMAVLHLARR